MSTSQVTGRSEVCNVEVWHKETKGALEKLINVYLVIADKEEIRKTKAELNITTSLWQHLIRIQEYLDNRIHESSSTNSEKSARRYAGSAREDAIIKYQSIYDGRMTSYNQEAE